MQRKSRATITDVAHLAQVSPKSISRVINGEPGVSEETRQRILKAISELGYVANTAARRLRGVSKVIGLVVSGFEDYAGQVVRGMSQAAQHFGYNLVLYVQHSGEQDPATYQELIGSGLISGMLMVIPYDYEILLALCEEYEIPYVLLDYEGSVPDENVPTVTVTNRKGTLEAVRYLLALGHRKIGFITAQMSIASAVERLQGYRDALSEVGIDYDPLLVVEGDFSQTAGFEQTRVLMKRHPNMTAVVASDDLMALGAMDAIKDAGLRVGEDISVIGFDDIPMAATMHPPLTTVRQPMLEMGKAAVKMLVDQLEGHSLMSNQQEFATELVIRQSVGKIP
ncbi:MAG: LacI family DNA-binding transcriptional regulator [Chloroflexota bacterium]